MTSLSSEGARMPRGEWISCSMCGGCGVVSIYSARDFEGPGECSYCSAGKIWRYPSGHLALYPGGPFCGLDVAHGFPSETTTKEER